MRRQQVEKLRDEAAKPTFARLRFDRELVSEPLKPLFDVIGKRLFDATFDVSSLWRGSDVSKDASALFGDELELTPWAYITECRLDVGVALLLTTGLSVRAIGEVLGYRGDTFSKALRRSRGRTPAALRRAAAKGEPLVNAADAARGTPPLPAPVPIKADLETAAEIWSTGDAGAARAKLGQVASALRARAIREYAGPLGLALHEEGAARAALGDVDRAYGDLSFARRFYAEAGGLPLALAGRRRMLSIDSDTDTDKALTSAFCRECRKKLDTTESFALHSALRSALAPVSRDLAWFESCCDDCYRLVWEALSRARLGLEIDAYKAWWLSENVNLQDAGAPPSRGRVIAALAEVERRTFGDQLERLGYCEIAVADAVALGDPLLEAQARIWKGNVLRAMAQFPDARAEFARAAPTAQRTPWLAALLARMEGILADNTKDYPTTLERLDTATRLYLTLDLHTAGRLLIQQANVNFYLAEYEKSIALCREALSRLDDRLDTSFGKGSVPILMATCFALLDRWESVDKALAQCTFDREAYPGLAGTEDFNLACLEILRERPKEALPFLEKASDLFESLHRPLDLALIAAYSVEVHARLDNRAEALRSATAALQFFQAAECPRDTLEAAGKLRALLEPDVIDTAAVAAHVRRVARREGGWLPVLEESQEATHGKSTPSLRRQP